ncbi:MAG: hypothetical protein R2770_05420 [Acidimicrobiales bacterium]
MGVDGSHQAAGGVPQQHNPAVVAGLGDGSVDLWPEVVYRRDEVSTVTRSQRASVPAQVDGHEVEPARSKASAMCTWK